MNCQDARFMLIQGVEPSPNDLFRATLGFHLAGCPACRNFRARMAAQEQLARTMTTQPDISPTTPPAAQRSNRAGLRKAGAAVMVGGLLTLVPATVLLPNATAHASPAAVQTTDVDALLQETEARLQAGQELLKPVLAQTQYNTAAQPNQPVMGGIYVVQGGDTLSSIAQRAYGDASLWLAIYEANVGVIGGNPGMIYPGQSLRIPIAARPVAQNTSVQDQGQGQGIYTVERGDTLSSIAQRFFGNADLWPQLHAANRSVIGDNPRLIFAGQRLNLSLNTPSIVFKPATSPAPGSYTVQRGDTLSAIAQQVYGDANRWSAIYEANRGLLGDNPHLIFAGQNLTIPAR